MRQSRDERGAGRRVRVIGVGDNTVDRYLHLGLMFPGGNAVNIPVFARRMGHEAAYIGCVADDERGELLRSSLEVEGIDLSRLRVVRGGVTSYSDVTLVDGDRVFTGSLRAVSTDLRLDADDLATIGSYDVVHTSVYSEIDDQLPALRSVARLLSYDFSDEWDDAMLARVFPHIDVAFLSSAERPRDEVLALLERARTGGPALIVATRGGEPAIVQSDGELHEQGIVETAVVDTLGAGDAFAARLLIERALGSSIRVALPKAAQAAADACRELGAWGHGARFVAG